MYSRREHINFVQTPIEKQQINKTKKTIYLILLVTFILFLGGCFARIAWEEKPSTDPNAYDPVTLQPKSPNGIFDKIKSIVFGKNTTLEGVKSDRINILLFGIGGEGHDGPNLTDTIILASIKPSTGQVSLISIPRDLAVNIPGYGIRKINNANAFGEIKEKGSGPEFARKVIEDVFDLKIPYYLLIDFKAFGEIIDEIGGVKIDVVRSFTDQMYPTENYEYQTVSFEKGIQTMNGATALKFARSRHGSNGEGSDFARAKRQQKIIEAVKEKTLSFGTLANPFTINKIINSLNKHINTNLSFADFLEFIRLGKNIDSKNIITKVIDDSPTSFLKNTYGAGGAFLLVPKTGNFDDIKKMIDNIFSVTSENTNNTPVQDAPSYVSTKVEILNGTWKAGLAARMKKRLEDKQFAIETIGNANVRPIAKSGIFKISSSDQTTTVNALQSELHIPIKEILPDGIKPATSTDILVLLGEDMDEQNQF